MSHVFDGVVICLSLPGRIFLFQRECYRNIWQQVRNVAAWVGCHSERCLSTKTSKHASHYSHCVECEQNLYTCEEALVRACDSVWVVSVLRVVEVRSKAA